MPDARLLDRLAGTTSRIRRLRLYRGLALGWLAGAVVALTLILAVGLHTGVAVAIGVLLAVGWGVWSGWPLAEDVRCAAQLVEAEYPELDTRLLTAVDLQPEVSGGNFGYLQMVVLGDVLRHARVEDWRQSLPGRRLLGAQLLQMTTFALFVVALALVTRNRDQLAAAIGLQPDSDAPAVPSPENAPAVRVTPGDVEIERGTGLLVTAEFGADLPSRVELVSVDAEYKEVRIPLVKSLDDPLFGGRIPAVASDLRYRVEFDGQSSPDYRVTTFQFPKLEQADADIQYPSYTGLANEHQMDVRRVSVVEGSLVTFRFRLNKPVTFAELEGVDGAANVQLESVAGEQPVMIATLTPRASERYRLQLTDDAGRDNKEPVEFVIDVLPNTPPEIKIAFPAKDQKVSPLQELALEGEARDDFGLSEHGLVVQKPDGSEEQLVLGERAQANARSAMAHQIDLEPLGVVPDDLVSFYFYADDIGPDGRSRRAFSDMFFAEVRPFEETYRQAPNQPSPPGEGSPSRKLIQLQRQVVSGSWNLMRHEPIDPPSASFPEEAGTLSESQQEIKALAEELAGSLEDLLMQQFATEAIEHMGNAQQQFADAVAQSTIAPLQDGRDAARRAYAALLKLQAREHAVKNSQSQSSSSQSEQQRDLNQQLKALELKNDRHRYETEQQAQQEQDAAAREALQVLNRLRELARRQEDLNDRIRQLENELRDAMSDAEREELQRQLKRLQQEQQELLRDVDEVRERMNREENRQRMADASEALDKTRERVFQSAQALKDQQTSKALAEGTRAQRELDQLKEQLREQTAGRFDEAVKELRAEARELAQVQEEIADELRGKQPQDREQSGRSTPRARPSLRPAETEDRAATVEKLAAQQARLTELLQEMRSLVEASETPEPLLSKRLYDAMRDARVDKPEEALAAAAELTRRGFEQPAQQAEEQARIGINKLKEGIDQAAESVLGNEDEALRRARENLSLLTDAVARELAQNNRSFAREQQQQQQQSEGNSADQQPQPGQNPSQPQQPGDQGQQPGNQPGEQNQPGQSPGQLPQDGEQPEQQPQTGQPGQQPGQPSGRQGEQPQQPQPGQPGQQPGQQGQPGRSPQGSQPGQGPSSQPSSNSQSQPSSSSQPGGGNGGRQPSLQERLRNSLSPETQGGGNAGPVDPLTGGQFVEWSDRMRDIEEMLSDPELRADVAAIREQAREMRIEFKRHSVQPNWDLVRTSIYGPMRELEQRLAEELARRGDDDRLVPIDRDPVPDQYTDLVKRYYQELSRQP